VIGLLFGILRVVTVLFVIRLVGRLAVELFATPAARRPEPRDTELVRDLVCNTFLPRSRALHATIGGQERHFCSPACAQRALTGPA
jgi:hypothetical protein